MKTKTDELLEFHKLYNEIYDEQELLPAKEGTKDYSLIEDKIIELATKLTHKLNIFKTNLSSKDEDIISEVDNMKCGCEKIMQNPYNRIGSKISL